MKQEFPHKETFPEHWLYWTFLSPDLMKKPLYTIENQVVNIIDPGRINYDNGPDILNAILEIDDIYQKGDIEFHIIPEDWFKHGHHEDRRYENLILHVLWDMPNKIDPMLLQRFPHLILGPQLGIPLADWIEKMTLLDQNEAWQNPKIPDTNSITIHQLGSYGQLRFKRKVERFKYWLDQFSFEDVLIICLAEALGYSKNKFPFRQLLWENPPSEIFRVVPNFCCSPMGVWVFLAMRADLLTTHSFVQRSIDKSPTVAKIHNLFLYFREQGILPMLKLKDWYFSRVRPANNPIIRLAALSQIIYHYHAPSLFTKMLQYASERLTLRNLLPKWQICLQLPFEKQLSNAIRVLYRISNQNRQIIGLRRINQFIINSVLPLMFLWAERAGNYGFQHYIEGLYENFPACEDARVLQQVAARFPNCPVNKLAIYQQGLYELLTKTTIQSQMFFEPHVSFA